MRWCEIQLVVLDVRQAVLLLYRAIKWGAPSLLFRLLGRPEDVHTTAVRLRRFIEEMGVTFVKLGQYLAIRLDILPPEVCAELSTLFAAIPPVSSAIVRRQVEAELGQPIDAVFSVFDPEPVGSASIAQVHRAITHAGQTLAIKVQRPGTQEVLQADIRNLRRIAWLADRFRMLGAMSAVELVDELEEFTLRELDFVAEARTAERVGRESPPGARVPQICWELTSHRLLAMKFVVGVSLATICQLAEAGQPDPFGTLLPGVDARQVVDNLARACLFQLFVTGHFHGDPHPANILIESDGTVVFIDFGIFGALDALQQWLLSEYVEALARGNIEETYHQWIRLVQPTAATDRRAYRRETMAILRQWLQVTRDPMASPADKLTTRLQGDMLDAMRRHSVRMRSNQILFWRALGVLDATANRLPIHFDLLLTVRTFFLSIRPHPLARVVSSLANQFDPTRASAAALWLEADRLLPRTGSHTVHVNAGEAAPLPRGLDAPSSRLALLLVGQSLLILTIITAGGGRAGVVEWGVVCLLLGLTLLTVRRRWRT